MYTVIFATINLPSKTTQVSKQRKLLLLLFSPSQKKDHKFLRKKLKTDKINYNVSVVAFVIHNFSKKCQTL